MNKAMDCKLLVTGPLRSPRREGERTQRCFSYALRAEDYDFGFEG